MNPIYYIKSFDNKKVHSIIGVIIGIVLLFSGCKSYLQVDPPVTSVNAGNVYEDNTTAIAVLTAVYAKMSNSFSDQGPTALSLYPELSADNLALFSTNANLTYTAHFQNALTQDYQGVSSFWITLYPIIYSSNAAIEGLNSSTLLNPDVKKRLLGEAYFMRAFNYFYLVNLYGDVPLLTSSVFQKSVKTPRTAISEVYQQILADLNQAKELLDYRYMDGTLLKESSDRIRPNLGAVNALLARTQLYLKNYSAAEAAATEVINQNEIYSSAVPLNEIFLKNSPETIWALQPVKNNYNTDEGDLFTLPFDGPNDSHPIYVSSQLINSFEPGDQRRTDWIGTADDGSTSYLYPAKYKGTTESAAVTEYSIIFRLAEQYLIRAEARNEQNNVAGAVQDLNIIRTRSRAEATVDIPNPLPDLYSTLSQNDIRTSILQERRVELFTEGGHRWFDLRRTGKIDEVMTVLAPIKGGSWSPYKSLYPIPLSEILLSSILTQNPGYN